MRIRSRRPGLRAALLGMVRLAPGFSYWSELLPVLLAFSIGLSMIVAPLTASGINNAVARVAGLLGIAVAGYRTAMWITATFVLAGAAVGIAGIRSPLP